MNFVFSFSQNRITSTLMFIMIKITSTLICSIELPRPLFYTAISFAIEFVHDGHVGGPKQYNDFPLGNIFYFYANIFYCFSPPT